MRHIFLSLAFFVAVPACADLSDDFAARARSEYLKPFALDLGGVLGAASVDPGVSLGFPGFEAGVVSGIQFRPDRDNRILRDSGVKAFGVPLVRGAVGLPLGLSVVGHGIKVHGVSVFGGGLRYSVFKPGLAKMLPSIGVSAFIDRAEADEFEANHYGANLSAGLSLPFVTPFAAFGYDLTEVKVTSGRVPAALVGQSAWARGVRVALGADLTPFPFMRLRAAYQLLHGIPGMTGSLLFKF